MKVNVNKLKYIKIPNYICVIFLVQHYAKFDFYIFPCKSCIIEKTQNLKSNFPIL